MDNSIHYTQFNSCVAVTPSDTDNLTVPAYIEVRGTAGNVVVLPAIGDIPVTLAMAAKEITRFRVRRVYSTSTTATSLVAYY